jgi:ABC-type glycerol-3-phosphate transport system substrate-binding protein
MRKIVVTGFAIGLLIVVTLLLWHHIRHPGDAAIRQKLIGSWGSENPAIKGAVTFNPDGSFAVNETFGLGTNAHPVQYAGTWQVEDGFLVTRTAQGSSGGVHVEPITRDKIIRVNDQEWVFIDRGTTIARKRSP